MKKNNENVLKKIYENMEQGLCISVMTLAELEHGIAKSNYPRKNAEALFKFLLIVEILPFDNNAAIEYGKICANLQKKGTPIGVMDMLIAAHAKTENLILVTNNTREFERVENLTLENWAKDS